MVGTASTFEDVSFVVNSPPSYVILKNRHYFLTEHMSQEVMKASHVDCTSQILVKLQRKIVSASDFLQETQGLSLSEIYQRTVDKTCTNVDKRFMETATEAITSDQDVSCSSALDEGFLDSELSSSVTATSHNGRVKDLSKMHIKMGGLVASCATQEQIEGVIENLVIYNVKMICLCCVMLLLFVLFRFQQRSCWRAHWKSWKP
jgi:hypothetical protein